MPEIMFVMINIIFSNSLATVCSVTGSITFFFSYELIWEEDEKKINLKFLFDMRATQNMNFKLSSSEIVNFFHIHVS